MFETIFSEHKKFGCHCSRMPHCGYDLL